MCGVCHAASVCVECVTSPQCCWAICDAFPTLNHHWLNVPCSPGWLTEHVGAVDGFIRAVQAVHHAITVQVTADTLAVSTPPHRVTAAVCEKTINKYKKWETKRLESPSDHTAELPSGHQKLNPRCLSRWNNGNLTLARGLVIAGKAYRMPSTVSQPFTRFEKSWPPFCQIWKKFTHLKLCIATATHNFEVVYRYRDRQLQVCENYSYLFNLRPSICKCWCFNTYLIRNNFDLTC